MISFDVNGELLRSCRPMHACFFALDNHIFFLWGFTVNRSLFHLISVCMHACMYVCMPY